METLKLIGMPFLYCVALVMTVVILIYSAMAGTIFGALLSSYFRRG
ncbi:MAG: hypothetical protein Q8P88_01255 [Candidatus Jorgensenbacteria bacterium]|nr:hypothetical protein [Candidatus Jorgensenbacteria bacterium]